MGPAVTSETVSCEREKRLRTTTLLSPHNTHSEPQVTGMNTENPGFVHTVGRNGGGGAPRFSSQSAKSSPAASIANSSRMNLSLKDSEMLSVPLGNITPHSVNIVNLKDFNNSQAISIFFKNNTHTMLPNSGVGRPPAPGCLGKIQVTATCDESVPCGTVAPHIPPKLLNSSLTENGLAPAGKVHHTIVIPKALGPGESGKLPGLESEPVGNRVTEREDMNASISCTSAEEESHLLQTSTFLDQIVTRQKKLKSDALQIYKRLRRLQCREVNSAVKEKLGQLVTSLGHVIGEKPPAKAAPKCTARETFGARELTALSTAELVSYVQKMQSSQQQQQQHQHGCLSKPTAGYSSVVPEPSENLSVLGSEMRSSLCSTSGQLISNLRHLKSGLDSDATESSSGGESGDESPPGSLELPDVASSLLARKKLEWQWANDRASIISRWTWLQAQVSDLEYRIRQQNDVYKQLRLSKGPVSLRDPGCPPGGSEIAGDRNGRIKINRLSMVEDPGAECQKVSQVTETYAAYISPEGTNSDSSASKNRLCTNLPPRTAPSEPTVDGKRQSSEKGIASGDRYPKETVTVPCLLASTQQTSSSGTTQSSTAQSSSTAPLLSSVPVSYDPSCRAVRCMEVRGCRRRTLLRTAGLHEMSRKASQLSTVQCTCYPPVTPCALCGGRYERVVTPGSLLSARERIALLDPSYHPVLSFPQDVPLPLQMAESLWKGPSRSDGDGRHRLLDDGTIKYSFRPVTNRLKNKINGRSQSNDSLNEEEGADWSGAKGTHVLGRPSQSNVLRGRRSNLHSMSRHPPTLKSIRKKKRLSLTRKHLSKSGLRASSLKGNRTQLLRRGYGMLKDAAFRRQSSRSTFDINNVVIPSHVTSAARVDIIQYKEIITPKWREIEKDAEVLGSSSAGSLPLPPTSAKRRRLSTGDGDVSKKVRWSSGELEPSASRHSLSTEPGDETDAEDEIENLSDEAFAARHLRHEIYEKKQCLPLNMSQQRRSRSNRSESDSFTLLNPQSPDVTNLLDASASLTSSTLSGGPSTSCLGYSDAEDPSHHYGDSGPARQHGDAKPGRNFSTVSWSAAPSAVYSSDQLAEHSENKTVLAWPPRTFPLGDLENEQLSVEHPKYSAAQKGVNFGRSNSPSVSSSSDSSVPNEEDPNDPEWTVTARNKERPGLLIKFAKF